MSDSTSKTKSIEDFATELFSLRPAQEKDLVYINSYAYTEGMDNVPSTDLVWVAVNDQDIPVGFIRISNVDGTTGHINPVVILDSWRGYGVGKALVDYAQTLYPELRLVSRGTSHKFYDALDFETCEWDLIAEEVASECDGCPMYEECGPQPYRRIVE